MLRILTTRRLRQLERAEIDAKVFQDRAHGLAHTVLREQARIGLLEQARDKAVADADYWRARAERFIDQIALKQGIICTPTMTEEPAPEPDKIGSVFSALGHAEINTQTGPAGAAGAAPKVVGVDEAEARQAVQDLIASTK